MNEQIWFLRQKQQNKYKILVWEFEKKAKANKFNIIMKKAVTESVSKI